MHYVVAAMGPAFLGSRLKRLGEWLQADAAAIIAEMGLPIVPAQVPVLTALRAGPLTIGQIAAAIGSSQPGVSRTVAQLQKLGLVESARGNDQRERRVGLSASGNAAMIILARDVWPRVGAAAAELYADASGPLLTQLAAVERALKAAPLADRARRVVPAGLQLVEWRDDLAGAFHDINAEWIEAMFSLEPLDRAVLENPRERIIDPGGVILFAEAPGIGIVGTCALMPTGPNEFELTKMGVLEAARGLKAGEFLLAAAIDRAHSMGARDLYLLTNRKCAAAIHLYEKLGFCHDAEVMAAHGTAYERCDVAMRFPI
ncbi:MAG: bifunctional helix-turn-helix transcriptional regulator/GNAT family N-acetyltransferase [Pseudomonadota bacterium]|nr:bifunctional helix-turn-helix transcriptional regulator/GNAT family N-acetyltransferase [Pseudomonadota bacterium]